MKRFALLLEGGHREIVMIADGEEEPRPMAPFMDGNKEVLYHDEAGRALRVIPSRIVATKALD